MHPPQPHGQQGIAVTTHYFALSWMFAAVKPKIFVNGYEMPVVGWGRNVMALATGQYHVHVYVPYFFPRRVGPSDYTVVVNPGQLVELEYRVPMWTFSAGSLGPPPQRYNGASIVIGATAVAVVLMIMWVALVVAMAH